MFFLLISIAVCSPLAFALWPMDDVLPATPSSHDERTCMGWLEFYNINDDNIKEVAIAARLRNKDLDFNVHWIAAGFISRLFTSNEMLRRNLIIPVDRPSTFCDKMGGARPPYKFVALKDFKSTKCEDFLYIYGYTETDIDHNYKIAYVMEHREKLYLSMWAAMYAQYVVKVQKITPSDFCAKFKPADASYSMNIIIFRDTETKCEETLLSFGFQHDNPSLNSQISGNFDHNLTEYVPLCVRNYVMILRTSYYSTVPIPYFCNIMKENPNLILS